MTKKKKRAVPDLSAFDPKAIKEMFVDRVTKGDPLFRIQIESADRDAIFILRSLQQIEEDYVFDAIQKRYGESDELLCDYFYTELPDIFAYSAKAVSAAGEITIAKAKKLLSAGSGHEFTGKFDTIRKLSERNTKEEVLKNALANSTIFNSITIAAVSDILPAASKSHLKQFRLNFLASVISYVLSAAVVIQSDKYLDIDEIISYFKNDKEGCFNGLKINEESLLTSIEKLSKAAIRFITASAKYSVSIDSDENFNKNLLHQHRYAMEYALLSDIDPHYKKASAKANAVINKTIGLADNLYFIDDEYADICKRTEDQVNDITNEIENALGDILDAAVIKKKEIYHLPESEHQDVPDEVVTSLHYLLGMDECLEITYSKDFSLPVESIDYVNDNIQSARTGFFDVNDYLNMLPDKYRNAKEFSAYFNGTGTNTVKTIHKLYSSYLKSDKYPLLTYLIDVLAYVGKDYKSMCDYAVELSVQRAKSPMEGVVGVYAGFIELLAKLLFYKDRKMLVPDDELINTLTQFNALYSDEYFNKHKKHIDTNYDSTVIAKLSNYSDLKQLIIRNINVSVSSSKRKSFAKVIADIFIRIRDKKYAAHLQQILLNKVLNISRAKLQKYSKDTTDEIYRYGLFNELDTLHKAAILFLVHLTISPVYLAGVSPLWMGWIGDIYEEWRVSELNATWRNRIIMAKAMSIFATKEDALNALLPGLDDKEKGEEIRQSDTYIAVTEALKNGVPFLIELISDVEYGNSLKKNSADIVDSILSESLNTADADVLDFVSDFISYVMNDVGSYTHGFSRHYLAAITDFKDEINAYWRILTKTAEDLVIDEQSIKDALNKPRILQLLLMILIVKLFQLRNEILVDDTTKEVKTYSQTEIDALHLEINRLNALNQESERKSGQAESSGFDTGYAKGYKTAEDALHDLQEENRKLKEKIEQQENDLKELHTIREAIFADSDNTEEAQFRPSTFSGEMPQADQDYLKEYMQSHKVVIAGGHIKMHDLFEEKYPDIKIITNENFDTNIVANADLVIVFYKFISHGTYYRVAGSIGHKEKLMWIPFKNFSQSEKMILDKIKRM